jgi:hypothetical protein
MKQDRITEEDVGAMLEEAFEGEPFKRVEPPPRFDLFYRNAQEPESFIGRLKRFLVMPSVPRRLVFSGAVVAILLVVLIPLMPGNGQMTYRGGGVTLATSLPSGRLPSPPVKLSWQSVESAVTYHVELTNSEGALLWASDTDSNGIDLPDGLLAGHPAGSEYRVRVIGYDADGAESGRHSSRFMVMP